MDSTNSSNEHRAQQLSAAAANKKRRVDEPSLLPKVLKCVSESNFLPVKEVGRLLLFTSKSIMTSAFSDRHDADSWKLFCCIHWGSNHVTNLLESTGLSPEECFRSFAFPVPKDFEGLKPLQYSPKDYLVIVTLRDSTANKSLICKSIKGEDIPEFFEKGEATIQLDERIWKQVYNIRDRIGLLLAWDAKVHVMRKPDKKVIQVADLEKEERVDSPLVENRLELSNVDGDEFMVQTLVINSSYTCLTFHNKFGRALMKHYFERLDRLCIGISLDYRMKVSRNEEDNTLSVFGFTLHSDLDHGPSDEEVKVPEAIEGTDVTFAHLLEALDVWDL